MGKEKLLTTILSYFWRPCLVSPPSIGMCLTTYYSAYPAIINQSLATPFPHLENREDRFFLTLKTGRITCASLTPEHPFPAQRNMEALGRNAATAGTRAAPKATSKRPRQTHALRHAPLAGAHMVPPYSPPPRHPHPSPPPTMPHTSRKFSAYRLC